MVVHFRRAIVLAVVALGLVFAYAYLGTGLSQLAFTHQADGSITAKGSTLIGQNWKSPAWFHGRPDDAGPYATNEKAKPPVAGGDNPLVANGISAESGGTNLGPRSKVLLEDTKKLIAYWHKVGVNPTADLVTTSGSGYDPDITPEDAIVQIPMVSKATGVSPSALRALISRETRGEQLGFLGSSYIVVLQLNEGLAKLK